MGDRVVCMTCLWWANEARAFQSNVSLSLSFSVYLHLILQLTFNHSESSFVNYPSPIPTYQWPDDDQGQRF